MNLAPIIVFAYDRPDHLRRTLDALAKNDLASQSELYIYCDGAKENASAEQIERIKENRKVAHDADGFKSVTIIEREKNVGLKANIVGAVTEIVNKYGRVITLEDDIVTSVGFLRYMNDALELYKDDEQVMHISGYMWPHRYRLPETFFYPVPYPGGGWATWQRAWKHYTDDTKSLYDYWCTRWDEFNKFGDNYLQKQLEANYHGTMKTWFIKWHAVMLKMNALTLYPGQSLTNNIGFDDQATNCFATTKFDVVPVDYVPVTRQAIKENKRAAREIYAFYQGRWYNRRRRKALLNKIKNFFKSLLH
ncbi:MAG: glycosyltransferase [Paludibacteraceae bacterium]|nr:glycosyltransferase [Paludibacteraceae bacterium]